MRNPQTPSQGGMTPSHRRNPRHRYLLRVSLCRGFLLYANFVRLFRTLSLAQTAVRRTVPGSNSRRTDCPKQPTDCHCPSHPTPGRARSQRPLAQTQPSPAQSQRLSTPRGGASFLRRLVCQSRCGPEFLFLQSRQTQGAKNEVSLFRWPLGSSCLCGDLAIVFAKILGEEIV